MKLNKKIAYFIDMCIGTKIPGLIMSTPGMGKTTTIDIWCKVHNYNLVTVVASQYSADDILGLQSVVDGKLVRLSPSWYNHLINLHESDPKNGTILFLDEITTCDEFIQAPLLNLIFNRSIGLQQLPEDVIIISAGNYSDNLNEAFNMTAPLVNRFMILNLTYSDVDLLELINGTENLDANLINYDSLIDSLDAESLEKRLLDSIQSRSDLSRVQFENSSEKGLFGFQSIRSISYCKSAIHWAVTNDKLSPLLLEVLNSTLGSFEDDRYFITIFNKIYKSLKSQKNSDKQLRINTSYINTCTSEELNQVITILLDHLDSITESMWNAILNRKSEVDITVLSQLANKVQLMYK